MWEELRRLVLAIAAKARRALEVGEAAVAKASDRTYKATLSTAVTGLERGNSTFICGVVQSSNGSSSSTITVQEHWSRDDLSLVLHWIKQSC